MLDKSVPWSEIAVAIRTRRGELRLRQVDAAKAGGISVMTWRLLESGEEKNFSAATLHGVTVALGWPTDAIIRLSSGMPAIESVSTSELFEGDKKLNEHQITSFAALSGVSWNDLSHKEKLQIASFVHEIVTSRQ